jgi:DNA-binding protein HU-beta
VKNNMETVSKSEIAHRVADWAGVTQETALNVVNAFLEVTQGAVEAGHKVTLLGFGTFEGRERAARQGRNPQSGEKMTFAARTSPAFKASTSFKKRVNDAAAERQS